jgi:hypothetical protein
VGLRESAKKAATSAAGIAAATSGLSTCNSGGGIVVDPAPPPLICSNVAGGQTLVPSARREGNVVTVSVRATGVISQWQVTRVGDVVGATVSSTTLPRSATDSLIVVAQLATPTTTQVDFTVEGQFTGYQSEVCGIRRTFHLTIGPTGIQISEMNLDLLPLPARNRAEIAMIDRVGRTISLEARTSYEGARSMTWEVTGGSINDSASTRADWTLPTEPGIYQAELLIDYGDDGMAFDALMLEVLE